MPKLYNVTAAALLWIAGASAADDGAAALAEAHSCPVALLRNGFAVSYARREVAGAATRLWLCEGDGYVEFPSGQIESFEAAAPAMPRPQALQSTAPQAPAVAALPVKQDIEGLIAASALRHLIDPDFVASVAKAESGLNPSAVSPKGAQGLMQLMPRTAAELGVGNPLDPAGNLEGGTAYLQQLLEQYGGDAVKALAAYNAGPQRVTQYGGVPPYPETRAYVARVIKDYNRKKLEQQAQTNPRSEARP